MLQQKGLKFLASLDECLQSTAFDSEAEAESQAVEVDAVGREQFHVAIVDETNAVEVDQTKVRSVRFNLADIYHFVDLLLRFISEFKGSWYN